jgi:hypothetical protein
MCKSYGICRTRVVYCNQDKHAWHFHKYLMSNHSSAMILWLSKISLISNQQDFHNLQPSKELVEPTSNNGMETCLQMHFLVRGNMLICMGGRRGGRLSRMAAKSSAISSLVSGRVSRRRPSSWAGPAAAATRVAAAGALHPPTRAPSPWHPILTRAVRRFQGRNIGSSRRTELGVTSASFLLGAIAGRTSIAWRRSTCRRFATGFAGSHVEGRSTTRKNVARPRFRLFSCEMTWEKSWMWHWL